MKRLLVLTSVVVVASMGVVACGKDKPSPAATQQKVLRSDMQRVIAGGAPGVIVLTLEAGRTKSWALGEGDVVAHIPMRVDDHFRIGSTTKSFVGAVVLQLAGEQKLSLDDTVERWVPGLIPKGAEITIRQLLNHTSGIGEYEEHPKYLEPYLSGDLGHVTTPEELVAFGLAQPAPPPSPTNASYANTNFIVLGLIVEKVTGTTLGAQPEQRLFGPLHLRETSYPSTPDLPQPFAHGYRNLGPQPAVDVTGLSPSMAGAAGGIVSTAADIASFYTALLGGKVVTPALLAEMKTTVPSGNGEAHGLGIRSKDVGCGEAWGHDGNFPGYVVFPVANDDGSTVAVVFINKDPLSMEEAAPSINRLIADAFCTTRRA